MILITKKSEEHTLSDTTLKLSGACGQRVMNKGNGVCKGPGTASGSRQHAVGPSATRLSVI